MERKVEEEHKKYSEGKGQKVEGVKRLEKQRKET